MAVIFSPIDDSELRGPYRPLPRYAFLMVHSSEGVAPVEKKIEKDINKILLSQRFKTTKATLIYTSKDYLLKIIRSIQGCGFAIAIFSEYTPAATLANIFFEIGICYVLGKDVIIVKTADANPPSDFVRTEWIEFDPSKQKKFTLDITKACKTMKENAEFLYKLGDIAFNAQEQDLELAFERYKQSVLLTNHRPAKNQIRKMADYIKSLSAQSAPARGYLRRIQQEIDEFLALVP